MSNLNPYATPTELVETTDNTPLRCFWAWLLFFTLIWTLCPFTFLLGTGTGVLLLGFTQILSQSVHDFSAREVSVGMILGFFFTLPVSYVCYRWSVEKILRKQFPSAAERMKELRYFKPWIRCHFFSLLAAGLGSMVCVVPVYVLWQFGNSDPFPDSREIDNFISILFLVGLGASIITYAPASYDAFRWTVIRSVLPQLPSKKTETD